ncbi:MAG: GspL/Epsl periplasmic domain-containing protein, partial [Pseudohongiella sp.]|nr:GspL/Epsl periplasmic domain-containing protein [Pseudohongiella sp.]
EQGKTHTPQCLQVLVSSAEQTSPALQQLYQSLLDPPGILKSGMRVTQQSIQQVWSELILQGDDLVNVRQGEFAAPLRIAKYWKPLRTPVIAAMLAVCAVVGSVFVETTINKRRFQALENQVQQRYREVMPDGVLVDAVQQLTTQLTRFRAAESTPGPVTMLNAMLDAFESTGNLNLHRLSYSSSDQNSSEIQMSISAPTTAEILELSEKLGVGGWTAQAQNITRAGDLQQANLIVRGNGF